MDRALNFGHHFDFLTFPLDAPECQSENSSFSIDSLVRVYEALLFIRYLHKVPCGPHIALFYFFTIFDILIVNFTNERTLSLKRIFFSAQTSLQSPI